MPTAFPKIFLSYARGDDVQPYDPATSWVHRLASDLKAAGFDVWFDRLSLPSRGLTFHQEIRDAVAACDRLLLVVGPKAASSEYVQQEWQFAWFEAEKVVTPILRKGDYPLAIPELALLHAEDFRDDSQYAVHLKELIRILNDPAPKLGKLIGVPSLPAHYLSRTDRLIPLRDAVRSGLDTAAPFGGAAARQQFHGIAGTSKHVGVHGMGGIGKSVLANLLAHDREIRKAFPDGIVWVGLGSVPILADLMRRVHKDLGGDGAFATEHEAKLKLKELLADKALLLIIDDAWRREDVDAFDILGPRCRALITTRDAGLLTSLGGTHHVVELLTDAEALRLLAVAADKPLEELPAEAHQVLQQCGRLPLAVALAGGLVVAGTPWASLQKAFERHKLEFLENEQSAEPQHRNLWKTIEISVQALPDEEQTRLVELAVFPEDEAVPEAAIATLWEQTGNLDDLDTQQLLIKLKRRSLIQVTASGAADSSSIGRVSMHDLIHDYCVRRAQSLYGKVSSLDDKLLTAYRAKCSDGWPSGPNDGYFFEHLRHHLVSAGHSTEAFQLLQDLDWLGAKTRAGLVFDLVRDVHEAEQDLTEADRTTFLPWSHFLRGNASFLGDHPASFFQQAYNEPVDSPVSKSAQHLWSLASGTREKSASASPTLVPTAFLEWLNRPGEWQQPACLMTLIGHTEVVTSVAFSGDGSTVVSGSDDQTIKVWDAKTGACRTTLNLQEVWVNSIAISRDGSTVVSGSQDWTVRVWDARTRACRDTLHGHTNLVSSVAFSEDGSKIVSGSNDLTVRVWNVRTGACRMTLQGHRHYVNSVALSGDGSTIVSGSDDETVKVWDEQTGLCRMTLHGHASTVLSVAISVDGSTVVSGSGDQTVKVWDAHTGFCRLTLTGHTGAVRCVAISGDMSTIVSGAEDETVKVWDASTGECNATFLEHTGIVTCVALSDDGSTIVSGAGGRTVRLWDVRTGASRARLQGHTHYIRSVAISGDGSTVVSGSYDNTVKVWDAWAGACRVTLQGHTNGVETVAISCDGSTVVSGSLDHTVKVWDAKSGDCRMTLDGHEGGVKRVAISGDGSTIGTSNGGRTVKVWDMRSGICRATLQGHLGGICNVAFSHDGSTVASGSDDETVKVWDAWTGACRATLKGHTSYVFSVTISGDAATIVSGSGDNTVKVWDAVTGICRATLKGHTKTVYNVAISSDGFTVVSGSHNHDWWVSGDGTAKVWDVRTGECLATFPHASPDARAAWLHAGAWSVGAQCEIVEGALRLPDPDGATPLAVFGPFEKAYGPLVDNRLLAFSINFEAFWFQVRRRKGS